MKSPENSSVTAIIPAFRSEKVVIRAIESVLNQSSPVDEIIIVDDASDDDNPTYEYCRKAGQPISATR